MGRLGVRLILAHREPELGLHESLNRRSADLFDGHGASEMRAGCGISAPTSISLRRMAVLEK